MKVNSKLSNRVEASLKKKETDIEKRQQTHDVKNKHVCCFDYSLQLLTERGLFAVNFQCTESGKILKLA